jgi:hypothetical protein
MRTSAIPLILTALALVVVAPAFAGKAEKTGVKITIAVQGPWSRTTGAYDLYGEFHATGAIRASGTASSPVLWDPMTLELENDSGSLTIEVTGWAEFEIIDATGAYVGLSGGGSVSVDVEYFYPKGTTGRDKRYGAEPEGIRLGLQLTGTAALHDT